jgi:predicted nucleotidyltransferase
MVAEFQSMQLQLPEERNRIQEFRIIAMQIEQQALGFEEVEAVILLGGLARGYTDDSSDLDISIIARGDIASLRREFDRINKETTERTGIHTDIEVHAFDEFALQMWGEIERFTFSNCLVSYDRHGRTERLIKEKLALPGDFWTRAIVARCINLSWHVCPEPPSVSSTELWVGRGDLVQAHYCLNHSVDLLLELLFALNREFMPAAKWQVFYARRLRWKPVEFEQQWEEMLLTKSFDISDLSRRQDALRQLWPELLQKALYETNLDMDMMRRFYEERIA